MKPGPVSMLDRVKQLSTETLDKYLETRDANAAAIPAELAEYIDWINIAANFSRDNFDRRSVAIQLQEHIEKVLGKPMSINRAQRIVDDSIALLHTDCHITAVEWNALYADRMDQLAELNKSTNNMREARRCTESALRYHVAASDNSVDPALTDFKHQLISPDVKMERMGGRELTAGEIKGMLEQYGLTDKEGQRILDEAMLELGIVEDVEFEEVSEETK